jgi:opacity protein-like surface antigen
MKKLLVGAALCSLSIAGPARAADMPINVANAPLAAPAFTWTSCYLGAHAGGGLGSSAVTDPVQLVQDSFLGAPVTTGVTTANVSLSGVVAGGQMGCDYQFAPSWVIGIEGAASGSNMKGSTSVGLPLGLPGETALVTAKTDFIPSVTARFGYAVDRWLLYVKGGGALAGDEYSITGTFTGVPFDFEGLDSHYGWTAGGGIEWAFSGSWSANLEYDYYQFGHDSVLMSDSVNVLSGLVDIKQSVQIVKAGVNFHIWGGR